MTDMRKLPITRHSLRHQDNKISFELRHQYRPIVKKAKQ